ncbi:hypothetical protein F5Y17DRAFT_133608 [Xylariaceae sp. FL0594]|nr:hypothetical protein F5Y17DRAFT_133608 [Xylariaceae sp. FL0594]
MRQSLLLVGLGALTAIAAPAGPSSAENPTAVVSRDTSNATVLQPDQDIEQDPHPAEKFLDVLHKIVPGSAPTSIPEALSRIQSANSGHPPSLIQNAINLVKKSIVSPDLDTILAGYTVFNNQSNVNTREPEAGAVYPRKSPSDAPYSVSEAELRSKIYIPPTFTYGAKRPVILVPGTGSEAGTQYASNFGKLLAATGFADPVYVNVPHHTLDDVQRNAEFVAYATNYISGISGGRDVAVLGWSQASVSIRWAHKYWPSTRAVTAANVNLSPDYHGTVLAYLLCPGTPDLSVPCPPAVLQQEYTSTFIATLRADGGDSAYVPTTSIYSLFDEIVQPRGPGSVDSGFSYDTRGVGVTNILVQEHCSAATPAGAPYVLHEGLLYNALAVAAAFDAIEHGEAADLSRIDVPAACAKSLADGLVLEDIFAIESTIPIALLTVLSYVPKVISEPPIKAYAL